MAKSLTPFVAIALALALAPAGLADVAFTAVERPGIDRGVWDFGIFDGAIDASPDASRDTPITSGAEMFWQLAYNGAGLMTYSWGNTENALSNSIKYDIGPESFDYITVAAQTKPNSKPVASVNDLVLKTDIGILKGESLESGDGNTNEFTFGYNGPQTFNAFTLTGYTTFSWNGGGSNPDYLAVVITGGTASPVVGEPATYAMVLVGFAALGMRARRRASAFATSRPASA